jgi:hypothetical protein
VDALKPYEVLADPSDPPGSILFVNALAASILKLLPAATEAARRIVLHRSKVSPLITENSR